MDQPSSADIPSTTDFNRPIILGRTGLNVGRLGISSSFGAPAAVLEAAFERGCNYFTWGTFPRGRSRQMLENLETLDAGPMSAAELERMRRIGDYIYRR